MPLYRNTVWFLKGLREFTQSGYQAASKHFRQEDLEGVSCRGKAYMITGANSGIGKEVRPYHELACKCFVFPGDVKHSPRPFKAVV